MISSSLMTKMTPQGRYLPMTRICMVQILHPQMAPMTGCSLKTRKWWANLEAEVQEIQEHDADDIGNLEEAVPPGIC